jgi:hypothetical protein
MAKTIGEVITSIESSSEEEARISTNLRDKNSTPFLVLTSKINSIDDLMFWKRAQKIFQVNGFREGHPNARELVLRKALKSIENPVNRDMWPLYRNCAKHYVVEDLPALNRLLLEETFEEKDGSFTEQIFKNIVEKAPAYSISAEDIHCLYQIWPFERSTNIDSIISAGCPPNFKTIRKIINTEIDRMLTALKNDLNEIADGLELREKEHEARFQATEDKISDLSDEMTTSTSVLRSEFQNLTSTMLSKKVIEITESVRKLTKEETAKVTDDHRALSPDLEIEFQRKFTDIHKRLQIISDDLKKHPQTNSRIVHSETTPTPDGKNDLTSVMSNWRKQLEKNGYRQLSERILAVSWACFRSSSVLLTQDDESIKSLLLQSGVGARRIITANPLWTSFQNWKDGFEFISMTDPSPRCLIIKDFDVALQECYLIPGLIQWLATDESILNKVVLVPAHNNLAQVSFRLLEFGLLLPLTQQEISTFANRLEDLGPLPNEIFPSALTRRDFIKVDDEEDLRRLAKNEGIDLPQQLLRLFVTLRRNLIGVVGEGLAPSLALQLSVSKWIRLKRGEALSRAFDERFQLFFGGS